MSTAVEDMIDEQEIEEAMEASVPEHHLQLLLEVAEDMIDEQEIKEAVEASIPENALQLLWEEAMCACLLQQLQIQEEAHSSLYSNANSSTAPAEVSSPNNARSGGKEVEGGNEDSSLMKQPCGICLEDKNPSEIFDNMVCSHRFCCSCITLHILSKLQENLVSIDCPEPDCSEHLTPEQCLAILPKETFEEWSLAFMLADIPPSQKFYCPFQDCSALLLKDTVLDDEIECSSGADAVVMKESECPECRRLFCAQCGVPWHAVLDCSEVQKLSDSEKEKCDLMLFKLAKENEWQRCARCKYIIERNSGCRHMTCRCGYQFCYKCGTEWNKDGVSCNCSG